MSILKKAVAGLLAVSAIFTLSACNVKNAVSIGEEQIPAGVYIYFINSAYSELSEYATEAEYSGDIWDFTYEDKSAEDWINSRAEELCVQLVAVERKFDELGLTLETDDQSSLDTYVTYYWDYYGYGESMEYSGISKDSYTRVLRQSTYANKILLNMYGVGGSEEISVDDLKATMDEEYYRISTIYISSIDEETSEEYGEDSEEYAALEKEAKAVYALVDPAGAAALEAEEEAEETTEEETTEETAEGETEEAAEAEETEATDEESETEAVTGEAKDFTEILKQYSDSYAAPADDATDDEKAAAEEELALGEIARYDNSAYSTDVLDVIEELEVGEIGFAKGDDGWYIVKKLDMFADEKVTIDDYRDDLIISMKEDAYSDELLDKWEDELRNKETVTVASGATRRYSPKKVDARATEYEELNA